MIPSWDKPNAGLQPESTSRPKRKLRGSQKSGFTPSQVPTEDGDDVEMAEAGGPSVAVSARKSNSRKVGSKRRPQESPQARRSSKRPRGTTETVEPVGDVESEEHITRVDLAEYTFDEDTPIDLSLVPALNEKVSFVGSLLPFF